MSWRVEHVRKVIENPQVLPVWDVLYMTRPYKHFVWSKISGESNIDHKDTSERRNRQEDSANAIFRERAANVPHLWVSIKGSGHRMR